MIGTTTTHNKSYHIAVIIVIYYFIVSVDHDYGVAQLFLTISGQLVLRVNRV